MRQHDHHRELALWREGTVSVGRRRVAAPPGRGVHELGGFGGYGRPRYTGIQRANMAQPSRMIPARIAHAVHASASRSSSR